MKNVLEESLTKNSDNPFLIKGKRKMIVNLNKIIPRSLSEEKARAKYKVTGGQMLDIKDKKMDLDATFNSATVHTYNRIGLSQPQRDIDFILGVKPTNVTYNDTLDNEYDPMKETACFNFMK